LVAIGLYSLDQPTCYIFLVAGGLTFIRLLMRICKSIQSQ